MRKSTVFIQIVCAGIGALFLLVSIGELRGASLGGAMLGSMMLLFAALLGADHTTNPNKASRQIFKVLALISAAPVVVLGLYGLVQLARASQWMDLASLTTRLAIFCVVVLAVAFDHHPRVQSLIRKFGMSSPKE